MSRNSLMEKALAAAMGAVLLASGTTAFAGGDRFECRAPVPGEDASMSARFEDDDDRMKFSASFEAAPGGSFAAGDMLGVTVDGELVAVMELAGAAIGDVTGDVDFDTTAQIDDADSPFPVNFPATGAGIDVMVGTFGCTLQAR